MLFKLTANTPQGEPRSSGFPHPHREVAYTVGQTMTQKGDSLLEITLIDADESQPLSIAPSRLC